MYLNTPYCNIDVRVHKYCGALLTGVRSSSNAITMILPLLAPSAPPDNLVISDLESRSFHLDWAPPPIEATNGILRKYLINITELTSGAERIIDSFNTSLEVDNVHPHTTYIVSVSAFTVRGGTPATMEVQTLEDST